MCQLALDASIVDSNDAVLQKRNLTVTAGCFRSECQLMLDIVAHYSLLIHNMLQNCLSNTHGPHSAVKSAKVLSKTVELDQLGCW
jgi:hypothetical protein